MTASPVEPASPTPGGTPPASSPPRRGHPIRNRVLFYLALLVLLRLGSRHVYFPGCAVALPDPRVAPTTSAVAIVDYPTRDGLTLRGAWVHARPPGRLTALYFHGNAESAATCLPLAYDLARAGVDTFLAEYRGYGGLAGSPSEEGCAQDAAAALEVLRAGGVADDRLVIVGHSIGSGVAVELASHGCGRELVLVSPFSSLMDVAWRRVGPLAPLLVRDPFDSLGRIGSVKVPIVVFHGTDDGVIPFALGERLATAAHARFVPVPGRGHNDMPEDELLTRELGPLARDR